MTSTTYEITSTTFYAFTSEEALEISQADPDFRPFDDNGGETDGPSYLVELSEWPVGLPVENILSLVRPHDGYRLDGYTREMQDVFKEVLGNTRWMGHQSGGYALFLASDKQLAALEAVLAELETEE